MPEIKHHTVRLTYQVKIDGCVTAGRAIDLADLAITLPKRMQTSDATSSEAKIIHSEVDTL